MVNLCNVTCGLETQLELYLGTVLSHFPPLFIIAGASGLVHFDSEGERNLDYSIYDLQHVGGFTKFVPILHFDSHKKDIR